MLVLISEHVRNKVPEHYQNLKDFEVLKTNACNKPHLLRCGGICFFDIGRIGKIIDIFGNRREFEILDEVYQQQSNYPGKVAYLQKMRFFDNGEEEIRLGYYVIAQKGRVKGSWVWGSIICNFLKKI